MNICVEYIWNDDFAKVAELTLSPLQAYVRKHGYAFSTFHVQHCSRNVQWERVSIIQDLLNRPDNFDAVFHIDADVLITNPEIKLESLLPQDDWDIAMSRESSGSWNDGTCLFHNTECTRDFLQFAWDMENGTDVTSLNGAVQKLWDQVTEADHVTLIEVPKRSFNSYPEDWQPGDFVLHAPARDNATRCEIFKRVLETGKL